MTKSTWPTLTRSPSANASLATVPLTGDGSWVWDLSVSTSTTAWSRATVSPGRTSQLDDLGLLEALPDVGELELDGHQPASRVRRIAATTRARSGT